MEWLKKQSLTTKKKLLACLSIALIMEFFIGVVLVNAQVAPFYFEDHEDQLELYTTTNQSWCGIGLMATSGRPSAYSGDYAMVCNNTFSLDSGGFSIDDDPLRPNATSATTSDLYVEYYYYLDSSINDPNTNVAFQHGLCHSYSLSSCTTGISVNENGAITTATEGVEISTFPRDEWVKMALEYDYSEARLRAYVNDLLATEQIQANPDLNFTGVRWSTTRDQYFDDFAYWDGVSYQDFFNAPPAEFEGITPLNFETRFTNGIATGTASTSISLDIDYILETSEYTANTRPDYINAIVIKDNFFTSDEQVGDGRALILPLVDGANSKNVPLEYYIDSGGFPDGDYYAYVNFFNINTNQITFSGTGLTISFEISGGSVTNTSIDEIYNGLNNSESIEYQDCGITNLYGCFVNALVFTFVPAPDSFEQFVDLWDLIDQKAPFGYVTSLTTAYNSTATTTPAFDFGNIPFISVFFDPFKLLLSIGLWFIYGLYFFGRMDKLDI